MVVLLVRGCFEAVLVNILLGVHTPLSVVPGGEDWFFGSGLSAVVGGVSLGLPDFKVLEEKERVALRVFAVFDKP